MSTTPRLLHLLGVLLMAQALTFRPAAAAPLVGGGDVVVCLGDSITDGYTWPLIVMQAIKEAGKPVPVLVCAGVGGHTAPQMRDRLDESVLTFQPRLVTLLVGTNDVHRKVTPADYEAAVREIARRVVASGATMVLSTPKEITLGNKPDTEEAREHLRQAAATLDAYERALRSVAADRGFPVAETRAAVRRGLDEGRSLFAADGIHPNYAGQALIARAFLDATGYPDVPLPGEFRPPLFPGVLPAWRVRPAPRDDRGKPVPLAPATAAATIPDDTWTACTLPEPLDPGAPAFEWANQLRHNGFVTDLDRRLGQGPYHAAATLDEPAPRQVYLQLGGYVRGIWLNGAEVYRDDGVWRGFHAGYQRLPLTLPAGPNRLLLEVGGAQFFLAVTPERLWERALFR